MKHPRDTASVSWAGRALVAISATALAGVLAISWTARAERVETEAREASREVNQLRREHAEMAARLASVIAGLDQREEAVLASVSDRRAREPGGAFHRTLERARSSVFLIYSEVTYRYTDDGTTTDVESCWGTGFLVDETGHVVTNKHIAEPWKYDPDLCAMEAMGEIEILRDTIRIAAWPSSTPCLDEEGDARWDSGFNNAELGNLSLVARSPDVMVERTVGLIGGETQYRVHAVENDHDLALLRLDGQGFRPVPLASTSDDVGTLDRVLVLGFPRGQNGLERSSAELSASPGVVRKVERTIQVTAPIIPGNSGSPVFHESGAVIGIATRIHSETLGICLKVEHIHELLELAED